MRALQPAEAGGASAIGAPALVALPYAHAANCGRSGMTGACELLHSRVPRLI